MIDLYKKEIVDERIQWRRLKKALTVMQDGNGVISNLYIAGCTFTAIPTTLAPMGFRFEERPFLFFFKQNVAIPQLLGFDVDKNCRILSTAFHHVPQRLKTKEKVVPAKVRRPKK